MENSCHCPKREKFYNYDAKADIGVCFSSNNAWQRFETIFRASEVLLQMYFKSHPSSTKSCCQRLVEGIHDHYVNVNV